MPKITKLDLHLLKLCRTKLWPLFFRTRCIVQEIFDGFYLVVFQKVCKAMDTVYILVGRHSIALFYKPMYICLS